MLPTMALPPATAVTRPDLPWARLPQLPSVVYAVVPAVGGARQIYLYSERTGQTYEKRCHRPGTAPVNAAILDFARQYG